MRHPGQNWGTTEQGLQHLERPCRYNKGCPKKKSIDYLQDNVYTVQSLLKKRGDDFLVEWYGFPKAEATWEKGQNIPKFILKVLNICLVSQSWHFIFQFYLDDPRRFGQKLPNPKIKHSKNSGLGVLFHYLSWEGVEGGEWLDSSVFTLELSESTEISTVSACNTRKVKNIWKC